MIQNNYFTDNSDIMLQFDKIINWKEIVEAYEGGFRDQKKYAETQDDRLAFAPGTTEEALEYYRSIFESLGDISGNTVAPVSKECDHIGLKFEGGKVTFPEGMIKAFETILEAGVVPFSSRKIHGGLGIPMVCQSMYMDILARADASLAITVGTFNLSETIEKFGSGEMVEEWVPRMTSGEICGAMALTEPDYGSDLSNIQTKAVQKEDGSWRLTGTKRFITHAVGFHNRPSVILTLARTGNPESGARGLSFFLVKSEDVQIIGIEKKLGLKCSPTCEVVYEDAPAQLIGHEGYGLVKYSMAMMNTARLTIAAQAMGIASAAYYEANKYASEREQFGVTIDKIPAVRRMLDRMEREIVAMREILYEAARTVDRYLWKTEYIIEDSNDEKAVRKDPEIRHWEKLANLFTPISKYYISEMANMLAYDGIQIFGGSGYTKDYDAERIYRDARITNIYEGTTQLQIVAAIGGIVSGMARNGHLRQYIDDEMATFEASDELQQMRLDFEDIVEQYREIHEGDLRDYLALEVVHVSARFLMGMLLERSLGKLDGDIKEKRKSLTASFHAESRSLIAADGIRLKEAIERGQL